ncbi:hypothetical protein [Lysobacter gummosus]|uniref:hypothetical protein n=1 Tax=Lysobacter gummosus TaxID=262324 RepID=UPI00362D8135
MPILLADSPSAALSPNFVQSTPPRQEWRYCPMRAALRPARPESPDPPGFATCPR